MSDLVNKISLLHITDPHILPTADARLLGVDTAYYLNEVLMQAINAGQQYDLCLVTGDLVQTPNSDSYQRLLDIFEQYHLQFFCLPGNHDDFDLMQSILKTAKVNCFRHLDLDSWQLICLNSAIPGSTGGYLPMSELLFLEEKLRKQPELFTLIAVHHHCIPTQSQWMDTMIIKNADELFELIEQFPNVKLLINGHIHQAMAVKHHQLTILTTPSTCFQFKPHSQDFCLDTTAPGYRQIDLYADGSFHTELKRLPAAPQGLTSTTKGY